MATRRTALLAATVMVAVGGVMQVVDAWPQLVLHLSRLRLISLALVHLGALGVLAGVYRQSQKGKIGSEEVIYLAGLMLLTWSMDLSVVAR